VASGKLENNKHEKLKLIFHYLTFNIWNAYNKKIPVIEGSYEKMVALLEEEESKKIKSRNVFSCQCNEFYSLKCNIIIETYYDINTIYQYARKDDYIITIGETKKQHIIDWLLAFKPCADPFFLKAIPDAALEQHKNEIIQVVEKMDDNEYIRIYFDNMDELFTSRNSDTLKQRYLRPCLSRSRYK
jgi:hypothetical protein